jgi:hypothetical protein
VIYQLLPILGLSALFGLYALWQCIKYEPRGTFEPHEDITEILKNITPQDTPFSRSLRNPND